MLASVPRFYEALSHVQTNYGCHGFTTDLYVTLPYLIVFQDLLRRKSPAIICRQYCITYFVEIKGMGRKGLISGLVFSSLSKPPKPAP